MTLGAERSQLLVRAKRIYIAIGVLVAGLLAAWPFRQDVPRRNEIPPGPVPLELMLRGPEVALSVSPPSDQSPAAGLVPASSRAPAGAGSTAAAKPSESRPSLEQLTPLPELPVSFHSSVDSGPKLSAGMAPAERGSDLDPAADAEKTPRAIQRRSRIHYVRDGDSLESLAERFLGSRERAGQ